MNNWSKKEKETRYTAELIFLSERKHISQLCFYTKTVNILLDQINTYFIKLFSNEESAFISCCFERFDNDSVDGDKNTEKRRIRLKKSDGRSDIKIGIRILENLRQKWSGENDFLFRKKFWFRLKVSGRFDESVGAVSYNYLFLWGRFDRFEQAFSGNNKLGQKSLMDSKGLSNAILSPKIKSSFKNVIFVKEKVPNNKTF